MSGSNYFISVKQVFENEKKLRIYSFLKHSCFNIGHLKALTVKSTCKEPDLNLVELLRMQINLSDLNELEKNEVNVIYYVAGYVARGLMKQTTCEVNYVLFLLRHTK